MLKIACDKLLTSVNCLHECKNAGDTMMLKQIQAYWQSLIGKITNTRQNSQESNGLRAGHAVAPANPGFYTACMISRNHWDKS
jgi:hypothetical protein